MSRNILSERMLIKLNAICLEAESNPDNLDEARGLLKRYELTRLRSKVNQDTAMLFRRYLEQMKVLHDVCPHIGLDAKEVETVRSRMELEVPELASFIDDWIPPSGRNELIKCLLFDEAFEDGKASFNDPSAVLAIVEFYLSRLRFVEKQSDMEPAIESRRKECLSTIHMMESLLKEDCYTYHAVYNQDVRNPATIIKGIMVPRRIYEMNRYLRAMEREKRFTPTIRENLLTVAQDGGRSLIVEVSNELNMPRAVMFMLVKHIAPDNDFKPLEARKMAQEPKHLGKLTMLLKDEVGTRGILIESRDLVEGKNRQEFFAPSRKGPQKTIESILGEKEHVFAGKAYYWDEIPGGNRDYNWDNSIKRYGESLVPPSKITEQVGLLYDRTHRGGRTSNFSECLNVLVRGGFIRREDDEVNLTEKGADYAMRYYGELRNFVHLDVRFIEVGRKSSTQHADHVNEKT